LFAPPALQLAKGCIHVAEIDIAGKKPKTSNKLRLAFPEPILIDSAQVYKSPIRFSLIQVDFQAENPASYESRG
jgi:hypothetical protein